MAFDQTRGETLLFGTVFSTAALASSAGPAQPGTAGGIGPALRVLAKSETWIWRDSRWTKLEPPSSPPPRTWAGMAYDEARHEVVLFGGQDAVEHTPGQGLPPLQDTWIWNGQTWSQRVPTISPPPAVGPVLTYDPKLGRVIALVDVPVGDVVTVEGHEVQPIVTQTWTWDGATWAQLPPGGNLPGPRSNQAMAYDAAHGSLVLFGGTVCTALQCRDDADTWTFDGATWTPHPALPGGPAGRSGAAMAYDQSAQVIVMFGGRVSYPVLGDTWTWNGTGWTQAHPSNAPWPRDGALVAYDGADHVVVLYGGEWNTQSAGSTYYDVWTWANSSWTLVQPTTVAAPPEQQAAIVKAASASPGLRPMCSQGSSACMSVRGQPGLGVDAGYVVFDLNPAQGQNAQCVSYIAWDQLAGSWQPVGIVCGRSNGTLPQLGAQAQVAVKGCANVLTFPLQGDVLACVPTGTPVTIDDGPVALGSVSGIGFWWHLKGRGWIAHQSLLAR